MAIPADDIFRRAMAALQAGQINDAEHAFKTLLQAQPRHIAALNLLSVVLTQLGKFEEAEHYVRRALNENANSDATFYNYGLILKALNRPAEALQRFSQALAINPAVAETWNNRGTVLNDLRRYREAIDDFDKAISINSNYAEAFSNKGKSLAKLELYDQSLVAYDRALTLKPDLAEAWVGRGSVFTELKQYNGAFAAYEKALTLKPDLAEAWLGRGNIFTNLAQYNDAFAAYDKALTLKPDLKYAEGARLHAKLFICDWANLEADISRLLTAIRSQRPAGAPFAIISIPSSPADQLTCAKCCIAEQSSFAKKTRGGEKYSHDRLRIAYLSADLHDHATAYLMAGLFEQHNKSRFEMTAISFGPEQDSDMRRRIKNSFEYFIDARPQSDQEIAELIRRLEIDIAVDLKGFTLDSRPNIFVRRPAPIQVNYLGYPGTMGVDCFDYILADSTVIPEDQFEFYSEKVVWLPDSYQVNDNQRPISKCTPTRSECGLPETGFVYCCFNNTFKITPEIFCIWMRLLQATTDSVLWLLEGDPTATANLRREAEKYGVSPQRLIFSPRVALADHLARHRQADLFLDTLPYNAHTTASDALWAGLPILTCLGSTFAGRVAASLLNAVGLNELVTENLDDYEALGLKLARDRALLSSLKAKLAANRLACPLFDTRRFTRHLEAAYITMWERYQRGQAPAHFAVDAIASN